MGLDVFNRPAGKDNLRLKRTSLFRSTRLGYRLSRVHQLHNTAWMGWILSKDGKCAKIFPDGKCSRTGSFAPTVGLAYARIAMANLKPET